MNIDYILLTHGIGVFTEVATIPPSPISNFNSEQVDSFIQLSWTNPTDEGFLGVRIQRKIGSYPTNHTDGSTIFDGFATSYLDKSNLVEGTTYYYRAFTYDRRNNINNNISQQTSIAFTTTIVYTVIINSENSNPLTSVTYADDAINMVAGSNSWDSVFPFNEIKPVMFKNGTVNYYLNPNNFTQKLDGTTADITSGADGDVMIQFPKIYTYIRKVDSLLYVSISNSKVDANYKCYAHTKGEVEKDYLYIGAYVGYTLNSKLTSLSSGYAHSDVHLSKGRSFAQNVGAGYQLFSYYQFLMIQVLYLIKYKNLNSQDVIGNGSSYSMGDYAINGSLDLQGMSAGDPNSEVFAVKLFGIENLWGNDYQLVDGIMTDDSFNVYTTNENFNNELVGYTNHGVAMFNYSIHNTSAAPYITDVIGTNELGFLPNAVAGGSSTTYFTDGVYFVSDGALVLSGGWSGHSSGIFYIDMYDGFETDSALTCRLAFL